MNLHFRHHLNEAGAQRAPLLDLLVAHPPQWIASPANYREVRADRVIEQRHVAVFQRDFRLNKHLADRRVLRFALSHQRTAVILRHRLEAHFEEVAFYWRQIIQQPGNAVT